MLIHNIFRVCLLEVSDWKHVKHEHEEDDVEVELRTESRSAQ